MIFHHIYFILKYTFNLNSIFNIWIILKLNNSCWPVRPCNVSCIHRKCALGSSWQLCSLNFNQSAQQHHFCLSFHYRSNLNKEWGHGWLCYTFIWHFPFVLLTQLLPVNYCICESIYPWTSDALRVHDTSAFLKGDLEDSLMWPPMGLAAKMSDSLTHAPEWKMAPLTAARTGGGAREGRPLQKSTKVHHWQQTVAN